MKLFVKITLFSSDKQFTARDLETLSMYIPNCRLFRFFHPFLCFRLFVYLWLPQSCFGLSLSTSSGAASDSLSSLAPIRAASHTGVKPPRSPRPPCCYWKGPLVSKPLCVRLVLEVNINPYSFAVVYIIPVLNGERLNVKWLNWQCQRYQNENRNLSMSKLRIEIKWKCFGWSHKFLYINKMFDLVCFTWKLKEWRIFEKRLQIEFFNMEYFIKI
jgi:hypothetical protein